VPPCLGGTASFWVGALLAEVNGYPVRLFPTMGASVVILLMLILAGSRLRIGGGLFDSLVGGMGRVWPAITSTAATGRGVVVFGGPVQPFPSDCRVSQDFLRGIHDLPTGQRGLVGRAGPAGAALIYTIANIVVIGGVVVCLFFPAVPLPYHQALWPSSCWR